MKKSYKIITFLIAIVISCLMIRSDLYSFYKSGYKLCVENGYIWPVDCSKPITFEEYEKVFSFTEAIRPGYVSPWEHLFFSPGVLLLAFVIVILIFVPPKKRIDKENANIEKNKKRPNLVKLVIGLIPFGLFFIHGIIVSFLGFSFFFSTDYGIKAFTWAIIFDIAMFLPFTIIGLALIISYIIDLRKEKKKKIVNKLVI